MNAQDAAQTPPTESLGTPPTRKRSGTVTTGMAIVIAIVLLAVGIGGGYVLGVYLTKTSTSTSLLTETGSTLLYPLMNIWGPNYTKYNSAVTLSTVASGSGAGQTAAETGSFNIGASDAYVKNFTATGIINVPVATSAQLVYYNLPGVTAHLNLNATVLAMIYNQTITSWTNPLILAAQPSTVQSELTGLSTADQAITLFKRADSSGDTFIFTSYCYLGWSGFGYAASTSGLSGLSTKGSSTVVPETGNSGMVDGIKGQPGGIAYIGISYANELVGVANVNYAALGDNNSLTAAGGLNPANYVMPTAQNITEDANLGLTNLNFATYGLAISLIMGGVKDTIVSSADFGKGGTSATSADPNPYPIVNLEYSLIKTSPGGNTVTSQKLADTVLFLEWAITQGNAAVYLNQVGFVPLTPLVLGYDMVEFGTVTS
jgi:phosphate transport system substrate-binding protein